MPEEQLLVLIIGAHPDDADIKAGGTAARWCAGGHVVRMVSLTDGRAGHHAMPGAELSRRRRAEAQAAAAVIGASYDILDHPDGELDDRLEYRQEVIRLIRSFRPDLIITHRSTDYHPDHRFAGLLVQDASYLLTVPAICPEVPHLAACPVILHFSDTFTRPCRFEPHVVVEIDAEFDRDGRRCCTATSRSSTNGSHTTPVIRTRYRRGTMPSDAPGWPGRIASADPSPWPTVTATCVVKTYGEGAGQGASSLIEAFEVSEYGAPLDDSARSPRLFPFLPGRFPTGLAVHPEGVG